LLGLLAINFLMAASRKLTGKGNFLPAPDLDGDHHLMDRNGRWWREDQKSGVLEEAFRRPSGAPLVTPFVWKALFGYVKFIVFILGMASS